MKSGYLKTAACGKYEVVKFLVRVRTSWWLGLEFVHRPMSRQLAQSSEELDLNYLIFLQKLAFTTTLVAGLAKSKTSKLVTKTCLPLHQEIQS